MNHKMKLQPKYYDFILNGTKRIEIRLNDEKRKTIKVRDTITFYKEPLLNESFNVKIVNLYRYNNFNELFDNFDITLLADKSISKEELLNELEKFYLKEKQEQYGVLGIEVTF